MTNDELKKEFFKTARAIKKKCEQKSMETCANGKCPFSYKGENGGYTCLFDWNNFGYPYDWEFDTEVNYGN